MKMTVRLISLILAVMMVVSMGITASAENTDKIANEEALDFLVKLGVFGGYEDGSLKANEMVERDEMAKIIFVLYTTFSEAGAGTESFADVPADNWAAGYVSWCSANNIVGGYGDGRFGPDDKVTYDQALKMVCGALGYKDWDSRFWPTDVRRTALTTLGLGENLSNVKGSDYVTRAQIAQIVYNALYANMNETKKGDFGMDVPMTLIRDIWNVTETIDEVVATENLYTVGSATEEDDEITLDVMGDVTLEEIGLEKFNGKTDELIKAKVNIIKRNGEIIGTTIKSVYEDNVKLTLNKDNELCLNGEELTEKEVSALSQLNIAADGKVTETALTVPNADMDYVATACDKDADGVYDYIEWNYYSVYEVEAVGKNNTTFAPLDKIGTGSKKTVANEKVNSKVALAEDNVVVLIDRNFAVEVVGVVTPVTASVTKFGNNKITLTGAGEFEVNEKVFANADALALTDAVIAEDNDGEAKKFDFYLYNGKVFYAPDAKNTATENNYAILAYINTPEDPVLDVETQKFTSAYSAVLVIDGKETKVDLNATKSFIDAEGNVIGMADKATDLLKDYGKEEHIIGGYLQPNYALVTYAVDEDGYYTLKLVEKDVENYTVLKPGATVALTDMESRYFTITGTNVDGTEFGNTKVKVTDNTSIYYPYTKKETGLHSYLGIYTSENIYEDFEAVTTKGYTYLVKTEEDKYYTLETTLLEEELKEIKHEGNYKTDARYIDYVYSSSTQEYIVEEKGIYSTHYIMDIMSLKKNGGVLDKSKAGKSAQKLSSANLYAYDEDEEKYVKITAANTDVVKSVVIAEVDGDYLYTKEGEFADGIKITDSAVLWTFTVSVNGDKRVNEVQQVSLADVSACLDLLAEQKELENDLGEMRALIFTYKDAKGKTQVSSIHFQWWSTHQYGAIFPHHTGLIDNFGA